ncbi:HigA family addiction module antidote protein [bacterium]|nr:HigA family addiction module antidote protein [bacterium]
MNKNTKFRPDYAIPPGETLLESLEEHGMTQAELAKRTGMATKTINEIVKGKNALTPDTAIQLERVFGIPAQFWNNLEKNYRDTLARLTEEESLQKSLPLLKMIPLRKMISLGWIDKAEDEIEQLKLVLRYFGVNSLRSWRIMYADTQPQFRISKSFESDQGALAAWIRQGELMVYDTKPVPFYKTGFQRALKEIRGLTRLAPDEFLPKLYQLCNENGVVLALVPELPKARANGLAHWHGNNPLIQLSLYNKWADIFWFSFLHEAGHILLHGKKEVFVEQIAMRKAKTDSEQSHTVDTDTLKKEEEADRFASDILIPPVKYQQFINRGKFSKDALFRFANNICVHPGIIVGRLQHEGLLLHSHCNDLRLKYQWSE